MSNTTTGPSVSTTTGTTTTEGTYSPGEASATNSTRLPLDSTSPPNVTSFPADSTSPSNSTPPFPPAVSIALGLGCAVVLSFVSMTIYLKLKKKCCFAPEPKPSDFGELEMEFKVWTSFRPVSVKKADFSSYVAFLHKDGHRMFYDGFKLLTDLSPSHPTSAAESPACWSKSRFANILPYDHSRVKLKPWDEFEGSDFINANFIPGYSSPKECIATQNPLPETRNDFWRMVWEYDVDIIVMLAKRIEMTKMSLPKNLARNRYPSGHYCDPYWPEKIDTPVSYGDLKVTTLSESVLSDSVTRVMQVRMDEETRVVTQIHFPKWPDSGCPRKKWPFINFVTMVRNYKPQQLLVHCSNGVSRTGVFIAVDRLLQHVKGQDDIDVFGVILDMRNYRTQMVKTEEQFMFVYDCIRHYITLEDDIDTEDGIEGTTIAIENGHYKNFAFEEDDENHYEVIL